MALFSNKEMLLKSLHGLGAYALTIVAEPAYERQLPRQSSCWDMAVEPRLHGAATCQVLPGSNWFSGRLGLHGSVSH